ncbi:MAG: hypothetical protein JWR04_1074 [Rhodoglobus sp.]|nr:hypothetical protein [Rhodoglobus sp.]
MDLSSTLLSFFAGSIVSFFAMTFTLSGVWGKREVPVVVRILLIIGFIAVIGVVVGAISSAPLRGDLWWLVGVAAVVAVGGYGAMAAWDARGRAKHDADLLDRLKELKVDIERIEAAVARSAAPRSSGFLDWLRERFTARAK